VRRQAEDRQDRPPTLTSVERDTGLEPATFSLGMGIRTVGDASTPLQAVGMIEEPSKRDLQAVGTRAPIEGNCVPIVSPENQLKGGGGSSRGTSRDQPLLSVKEVACQLGIATATVYGLCAERRLAHVRILNGIRVAKSDLDAFIASCHSARPKP